MQTSGQINRTQILDQQVSRNEASLDQILNLLSIMRKCRLNRIKFLTDNGRPTDLNNSFTLEEILEQLESAYEPKLVIRPLLYGTIARLALRQGILEHVGYGRAAKDSSNHRECRTYRWGNSNADSAGK